LIKYYRTAFPILLELVVSSIKFVAELKPKKVPNALNVIG